MSDTAHQTADAASQKQKIPFKILGELGGYTAVVALIIAGAGFALRQSDQDTKQKEKTLAYAKRITIEPILSGPYTAKSIITREEGKNSTLNPVFAPYQFNQVACDMITSDGRLNRFENPFAYDENGHSYLTCEEARPAFLNGLEKRQKELEAQRPKVAGRRPRGALSRVDR